MFVIRDPFIDLYRKFQAGLRIVRVDLDTEELIKDKDGFCIEVESWGNFFLFIRLGRFLNP